MKWILWIIRVLLILILPFYCLVRGSIYSYESSSVSPWIALGLGMIMTILILLIYLYIFMNKLTGKRGSIRHLKSRGGLVSLIVGAFCIYGLIFLSGANVKSDEIRQEYLSLHPILRVAISSFILFDRDLIVTDASRMKEDYRKMGLPAKARSLHYRQSDGYVHAIDIRTSGRSEFRNKLALFIFRAMGFNTLRHIGTADHLHISISSRDAPGAI